MIYKVVWCMLVALFGTTLAIAQDEISPELQMQLDAIELATSDIRELNRLEPTILDFPDAAELSAFLRDQFAEEYSPEEFADDTLLYIALDLLEPGVDLETILFDFLLSQVAGFYDPETKTMNVILLSGQTPDESIPILEQITYSHEYVHALQDQHFDLQPLLEDIDASDNGDYQLAVLALVEGDATQVMTDYTLQLAEDDPFALAQAMLNSGVDADSLTVPDTVPEVIEAELLFPYTQGQGFVATIKREGGWAAVNDAFTNNLPQSTEHIYHPATYLAGEMPIEVTIPDLSAYFDDTWRMAHDIRVGEFYLRQHLRTQLHASLVSDLATGWGGDRLKLYINNTTGELAWVMYQVWDTPEDATEFVEGYNQFLDSRFVEGRADDTCWTYEDVMCFVQVDETQTRISYSLNADLARELVSIES